MRLLEQKSCFIEEELPDMSSNSTPYLKYVISRFYILRYGLFFHPGEEAHNKHSQFFFLTSRKILLIGIKTVFFSFFPQNFYFHARTILFLEKKILCQEENLGARM